MKLLTHVEVEWIDAQSSMDILPVSKLEEHPIAVTKSCGYLIKEDKEKIVLGFMLFGVDENDDTLMKHYQIIPRKMVKKIIKLFEPHGVTIKKSGEKIPIKYTLAYRKDGGLIYVLKDKKKVFKKGGKTVRLN